MAQLKILRDMDVNRESYRYSELLDACSTSKNANLCYHSRIKYDQDVENDIKEIVRQCPKTIHCNIGTTKQKSGITPLAAACYNKNIPIHMLEFLLENGADSNVLIKVDGIDTPLIDDLAIYLKINPKRYIQIEELFLLYGGINIKGAK